MQWKHRIASIALLAGGFAAAQQPGQPQLQIQPANRTLTVSASDQVTVDPDVAILHIGFQTLPLDAKDAYSSGARTSNDIINAIKAAGIPESAIHSEWQRLDSVYQKPHKFTLTQQWTVKAKPARAAEILDTAITAGANNSGEIDWTVENEQALADRALASAAARVRAQAAVLAKGMGVTLGKLIYVSNEVSSPMPMPIRTFAMAKAANGPVAPPLAIEPHKVTRSASVYAVFAIE